MLSLASANVATILIKRTRLLIREEDNRNLKPTNANVTALGY
jgi:hypothetical protein